MILTQHLSPLASRAIEGRSVNAFLSNELDDSAWDDFLRSDPAGQFQQSSNWAKSKQSEAWKCLRVTVERDGMIAGGFQMLWRPTRLGKIGMISKGPVLIGREPAMENFVLDVMLELARTHKLAAIIAQPPDDVFGLTDVMQKRGFSPYQLTKIIDSTLCVDVSGPPGAWRSKMSATPSKHVRRAFRGGVTLYEGSHKDVPLFFDLMKLTCDRQGVAPTPPTLEATTQLVQAFHDSGESRIAFAVYQGELAAGVLDLKFGSRYTAWKKGWNGRHSKLYLNSFLTHSSLERAEASGCTIFDFAGIERTLAEALIKGDPLTEEQLHHYDSAKLGFGGHARLLPPAMIYCRNPTLRFAYRHIAARPLLVHRLKALAGVLLRSSMG